MTYDLQTLSVASDLQTLSLTSDLPGSEPEFDKSDGEGSGAGWDVDEDLELPPDLDINVATVTGGSYNPPAIGTSTAKVCMISSIWFYLEIVYDHLSSHVSFVIH